MCLDNRLHGDILFWSLWIDFKVSTDLISPRKPPSKIRNNMQLVEIFVSLLFSGTISRNGTLIAPTCENTLIVPSSTTTTTTMAVCKLCILEAIELLATAPKNSKFYFLCQKFQHLFLLVSNWIQTLDCSEFPFLNSIFLRKIFKIHYFDPNMSPPNSKGNSVLVDCNLFRKRFRANF